MPASPVPPSPPEPAVRFVGRPEPEIEFLGRLARRALTVLRAFLWLAGAAAIVGACYVTLDPASLRSEPGPAPPLSQLIAHNLTFVCLGLPLLLPARWLFGSGRWPCLMLGMLLWFGPMLLTGDHDYGFVLRFFASFVACAVLMVLRVLSTLTATGAEPH